LEGTGSEESGDGGLAGLPADEENGGIMGGNEKILIGGMRKKSQGGYT